MKKSNFINLPSLSVEVEKINVENEIAMIEKEIVDLFAQNTAQETQDNALVSRIRNCIIQLEALSAQYKSEQVNHSDLLSTLASIAEPGVTDSAFFIQEAQNLITSSLSNMNKKQLRTQLRNYLIEGYAIINLVRAKFFGEIEYKVMVIGEVEDEDVLLEANPSLAKILEVAHFDGKSMSLTIRQSQRTFQRYNSELSEAEHEIDEIDTMLGMMKKVQLNDQEKDVWQAFQRIQSELAAIKSQNPDLGVAVNYGNLTETFLQYQIEGKKFDADLAYALLEKGRNNLAYYLGGDITDNGIDYQVKTLSAYGKVGRFDVATLSNVITPLKEILNIIIANPADLEKALQSFFTPSQGQGDRPFKQEAEKAVKNAINKVLKDMGFQ